MQRGSISDVLFLSRFLYRLRQGDIWNMKLSREFKVTKEIFLRTVSPDLMSCLLVVRLGLLALHTNLVKQKESQRIIMGDDAFHDNEQKRNKMPLKQAYSNQYP